jgi:hypothetical protein
MLLILSDEGILFVPQSALTAVFKKLPRGLGRRKIRHAWKKKGREEHPCPLEELIGS